jgi:hypothetical protein
MERGAQLKHQPTTDPGVLDRRTRMNTHDNSVLKELRLIQDALSRLAANKPNLLHSFLEVFAERSQFPELPESRGEDGLSTILSEILWTYAPDSYFDRHSSDVPGIPASQSEISNISIGLAEAARKYPFVIDDFRRFRQNRKTTIESTLEAGLRFYVANRAVLP